MAIHVGRDGAIIGEFDEDVFRNKIFSGELLPDDVFWQPELKEWLPISSYRVPPPLPEPPRPIETALDRVSEFMTKGPKPKKTSRSFSPAKTGGLLAVAAWLAPLAHESFFFLVSLPFLLAAFVLAIVSIVKGRLTGGIILLVAILPAFIASCGSMTDRDKILHHPEQLRQGR